MADPNTEALWATQEALNDIFNRYTFGEDTFGPQTKAALQEFRTAYNNMHPDKKLPEGDIVWPLSKEMQAALEETQKQAQLYNGLRDKPQMTVKGQNESVPVESLAVFVNILSVLGVPKDQAEKILNNIFQRAENEEKEKKAEQEAKVDKEHKAEKATQTATATLNTYTVEKTKEAEQQKFEDLTVKMGDGMRGAPDPEVRELQQKLSDAGYPIKVDGRFGPETIGAVRQFQEANGLSDDAANAIDKVGGQTVTRATLSKLNENVAANARATTTTDVSEGRQEQLTTTTATVSTEVTPRPIPNRVAPDALGINTNPDFEKQRDAILSGTTVDRPTVPNNVSADRNKSLA